MQGAPEESNLRNRPSLGAGSGALRSRTGSARQHAAVSHVRAV